jgi:hypothetical protein
MPRARSNTPTGRAPLCFVDAHGGAFAALAAALAKSQGRDAVAATSAAVRVPAEVGTVLQEVALTTPDVLPVAKIPAGAERVDVGDWGIALFEGEGELEHLALGRIARDRIERRVEALLATRG